MKYFSSFFLIEGSKEHAIFISYTSAGMLYNLIKACQKNELSSCKYTDIYNCRRSLSGSCYHLDTQVPLRLIRTFFSSSKFSKSRYQKLLNQHNRELGLQVGIYTVIFNFALVRFKVHHSKIISAKYLKISQTRWQNDETIARCAFLAILQFMTLIC